MSHRSSNPLASAYSFIHFWSVVYEGKRCWLVSVRPKDVSSVDSGRSGSVGTGEGEDEEQGEEEEEEEEGEGEEEEVEKREWLKITSSSSSSTRHTAEYVLLKNGQVGSKTYRSFLHSGYHMSFYQIKVFSVVPTIHMFM